MSQLIKATITPYEAVHFRQNARLVSSGNLDAERRRIMAMQAQFQFRYSGQGAAAKSADASQVRRAFAKSQLKPITEGVDTPAAEPVSSAPAQQKVSAPEVSTPAPSVPATVASYASAESGTFSKGNAYVEQARATYDLEKASFDLRVSSGDLSFVPAMDFTIVLQRPGVQFEYMGGFNYVPPSWSPIGENLDMVL